LAVILPNKGEFNNLMLQIIMILNKCTCEIDWAKVPDWIQAIGALIASIGLVITLMLQRKTLQEQQIITSLERTKFINSFLPILELHNIDYQKPEQNRFLFFSVFIRENYIQNLVITHNFPENFKLEIPYIISNIILPTDYELKFKIEYSLSPVFVEIEEYSGNTIILNFEDALGNKYRQLLIYKGSNNLFLHPAYSI
jgi:hypothetical protein